MSSVDEDVGAKASAVRPEFSLPPVRHWQLRLFSKYVTFYFWRHFHNIYLAPGLPVSSLEGWPVLICLNHPSWWDPLLAIFLSQRFFRKRRQYAPIAVEGLNKYKFFERLGFFGIDPRTTAGASRFFKLGRAVLRLTDGLLWVTAQGKFTDVRKRPVELQTGVGHLAHSAERFVMLPVAFEYAFWDERSPEAFVCFGDPVFVTSGKSRSAGEWSAIFAASLEQTQGHLSECVTARSSDAFTSLLTGRAGVGGVYDIWRVFKAGLHGRRFRAEHGRGN